MPIFFPLLFQYFFQVGNYMYTYNHNVTGVSTYTWNEYMPNHNGLYKSMHNMGEYLISGVVHTNLFEDRVGLGNYYISIIGILVELDTDQVIRVNNSLLYLILGTTQWHYHNPVYQRSIYGVGSRPKRGKVQPKRLKYTFPKNVCDFNLVMISSLASKCQVLKVGMPIFQPLYEMKLEASTRSLNWI